MRPPLNFVHAGDVHVARDLVAGDLHVADEVSASRNLSGLDHVTPPSRGANDEDAAAAPHATLKSFQEIYIRPKKGEDGLLSAKPDSRSAEDSLKTQKWVQLFGSQGVVDL